jgi:hypothetical protein
MYGTIIDYIPTYLHINMQDLIILDIFTSICIAKKYTMANKEEAPE